jgi:uncharacterized membrane protein YsdA (DUF1294 family)
MKKALERHKRLRNSILLLSWGMVVTGWFIQMPYVVGSGLLVVNGYAAYLTAWDKQAAKRGAMRIPESSLLGLAAWGGALGVLAGMLSFRHKTRHAAFLLGVPLLGFLQVVLAAWLLHTY